MMHKIRLFLMATALMAMVSCEKDVTTTDPTTDPTTGAGPGMGSGSSSSTGSTANVGGTTTGSDTYNPAVITVTGCSVSSTGVSQIVCLANALKATLTTDQIATLQLPYSKVNAIKWSNFPQALVSSAYKRIGLNFGSMTPTQIQYAKALIKAASGTTANEGWDELQQLLNADQYLNVNGGGSDYGAANYYLAFLGTPDAAGTFEIQFGGHHTAFANTYTNGVLVGATPSFRGVEPFGTFNWNGTINQPIQQEAAAFTAMLTGLSATQLATAKLSATYSDLVCGPQADNAFPATASGVQCSGLTSAQKALVLAAIGTYVNDVAGSDAIMTKYTNELDNTYVSYSGTTDMTNRNDYVRIDGPSVWIEYSCQNGIVLSLTHPHSVWRDKKTDYGSN